MNVHRFLWVDYAKFFAILGVTLVHVGIPAETKTFIYVWLIPLFFFLSGIFSKQYSNYPTFFKNTSLRILIPYLTFNIVTYFFWLLIGRHYGNDVDTATTFWQPLLGMIYGSGHSIIHCVPLWFLPCIFMTENLYFLIQKHSKSLKIKIVFIASCTVIGWLNYRFNPYLLPWGFGSALVMLVFYGLGDIIGKKMSQQSTNSLKNNTLLFFASAITIVFVHFWIPVNEQISVADNQYGNYGLFLVGASVGIIGITAFCKWLEKVSFPLKPLLFVGRNTLIIFGFHLMAMSFIKAITFFLFGLPLSIFDQTFAVISLAIGSIILCVPIIFIINKYFLWFIGKKSNI